MYSIANYAPFVAEIDDKINMDDFMEKNNQRNIMVNLSVLTYFSDISNKPTLHNFESTKKFVEFFDGLDEKHKKLFLDIDKNSKSHFDTVRFLRNFMILSKRNEYLEKIFNDLSSNNSHCLIFAEYIKKYEHQNHLTNKI